VLQQSSEQFESNGAVLPEDMESIVVIDIMALVDEMFGVTLSPDAIQRAKTADEILELVVSTPDS